MDRQQAETVAIQALGWMAQREETLHSFLGQSGMSADQIRGMASDPDFLAAVLDFILGDESMVTEFCGSEGLDPSIPMRARGLLPGGDAPSWT